MAAYTFPGNVRELENTLERAMTLADGEVIEADDLLLPANVAAAPSVTAETLAAPAVAPAAIAPMPPTPEPGVSEMLDVEPGQALPDAIEQMERAAIEQALVANRYNKTKTAAQLGITFRALRYKLKKLGID